MGHGELIELSGHLSRPCVDTDVFASQDNCEMILYNRLLVFASINLYPFSLITGPRTARVPGVSKRKKKRGSRAINDISIYLCALCDHSLTVC